MASISKESDDKPDVVGQDTDIDPGRLYASSPTSLQDSEEADYNGVPSTSATDYDEDLWLASIRDVARRCTAATPRVLENRKPMYHHNAEAIGAVFRDVYNFEVLDPLELPDRNANSKLGTKLNQLVGNSSQVDEENLLIIYYCGHAEWLAGAIDDLVWKPRQNAKVQISWNRKQQDLLDAECDLLFILDCCYSGRMVKGRQPWKRRCEVLSATDSLQKARAEKHLSFTTALCANLNEGTYVEDLGLALAISSIIDEFKLETVPHYHKHTDRDKYPFGIYLRPRDVAMQKSKVTLGNFALASTDSQVRRLRDVTWKSDAIVVIACHVKKAPKHGEALSWENMVRVCSEFVTAMRFEAFSKAESDALLNEAQSAVSYARLASLFRGSALLILSMPMWLWYKVEPSSSFQKLAVVRTHNLLQLSSEDELGVISGEESASLVGTGNRRESETQRAPVTFFQSDSSMGVGDQSSERSEEMQFPLQNSPSNTVIKSNLSKKQVERLVNVLGNDHPLTLKARVDLAFVLWEPGRDKEAEQLGFEVMNARMKVLGEKHSDTLTSMSSLALVYQSQGRYREAQHLLRRVALGSRKLRGKRDPITLISMANLASMLALQGQHDEALVRRQYVMDELLQVLGANHSDTLISMHNLAFTWHSLKQETQAVGLMQDCLDRRSRVLGSSHPDTLLSKTTLEMWKGEPESIRRRK
ncbi:hypothetical protein LTR84_003367 [Exophiala bonariae]|uniref:Uncharacterized protein n=1 Tax=Exophiala bonariae TaxID=1690606 RepID=A0AAV9N734_9EURO|nr:hypothetical protein LTR84_003367 [Exophiala bonariae]